MPHSARLEAFEKELNRLVKSFGKRLVELKQPGYGLTEDEIKPVEGHA
jgi:hypothetical protein